LCLLGIQTNCMSVINYYFFIFSLEKEILENLKGTSYKNHNNSSEEKNNRSVTYTVNSRTDSNQLKLNVSTNGNSAVKNPKFPSASLLKYEIRHLTSLKKIGSSERFLINKDTPRRSDNSDKDNTEENMTNRLSRHSDDGISERLRTYRSNRYSTEETPSDRVRTSRLVKDENSNCLSRHSSRESNGGKEDLSGHVQPNRTSRTRQTGEESNSIRSSRALRRSEVNGIAETASCDKCLEKQEKIDALVKDIDIAKENSENTSKQVEDLEAELDITLKERDDFSKENKKLQREIKKINASLDEEKVQTRRLGIKLEDANYEIGRLRQELITSQLEGEKIVEENEDLAVDNEDLIKERDEIIQIYDELYRESERLKHEVKIWKTVFENNKDNISTDGLGVDDVDEEEKENCEEKENSGEEVYTQSRHNVKMTTAATLFNNIPLCRHNVQLRSF